MHHSRCGLDLAVTARIAQPKTLAVVVEQRRSTHAVVLASDVDARVDACLTANALPSREAEATEGGSRGLIAFP